MTVFEIITYSLSLLTFLGAGTVISWYWKEKLDERKGKLTMKRKRELEDNKNSIREVIQEELSEIKQDITDIKESAEENKQATISCLRSQMKSELDYCRQKGFATSSEKANWNQLYNDYTRLGGNHFKEYVNEWKEEMEELPKEKKQRKQKLNEDK